MQQSTLSNRTAIVTGATSGIGLATAVALAQAGAHVFATGRSEANLAEAAEALRKVSDRYTPALLDVRDSAAFEALIARAVKETGRLNILVNNAAVRYPDVIIDGEIALMREMIETNLLAPLVGARAAVRAMRAGGFAGHIVNISSSSARMPAQGVYGATKAAIDAAGTTLRLELEDDPIRVVNVVPGATESKLARHYPQAFMERVGKVFAEEPNPRKFLLKAEDIARAILFAVSQPPEVQVADIIVQPQADVVLRAKLK